MGYILPITHHSYKNYQARMAQGDERPFYIGQIQPVFMEKVNEKTKQKSYYLLLEGNEQTKDSEKVKYIPKNNSDVTGKGKYINEQV